MSQVRWWGWDVLDRFCDPWGGRNQKNLLALEMFENQSKRTLIFGERCGPIAGVDGQEKGKLKVMEMAGVVLSTCLSGLDSGVVLFELVYGLESTPPRYGLLPPQCGISFRLVINHPVDFFLGQWGGVVCAFHRSLCPAKSRRTRPQLKQQFNLLRRGTGCWSLGPRIEKRLFLQHRMKDGLFVSTDQGKQTFVCSGLPHRVPQMSAGWCQFSRPGPDGAQHEAEVLVGCTTSCSFSSY